MTRTVYHSSTPYPIFSAGIDWLTATGNKGGCSLAMEHWADVFIRQERDAGRHVDPASRLGFSGHQGNHWFFGRCAQGCMAQLGGPVAALAATDVIKICSNVSRLDLQVTLWTIEDCPNLAAYHYGELLRGRCIRGKPPSFSLTTQHPTGDTLTINKRVSDVYLRIYDKAAESKLGQARSLWRYEVELKRKPAMRWAHRIDREDQAAPVAFECVQAAVTAKDLTWPGETRTNHLAGDRLIDKPRKDVLAWLYSSVRITVARQIKLHGREAVVAALGLT